jgi:hypothetical protein
MTELIVPTSRTPSTSSFREKHRLRALQEGTRVTEFAPQKRDGRIRGTPKQAQTRSTSPVEHRNWGQKGWERHPPMEQTRTAASASAENAVVRTVASQAGLRILPGAFRR